jgi:molecular chaperone GrpE (heat shock protein)
MPKNLIESVEKMGAKVGNANRSNGVKFALALRNALADDAGSATDGLKKVAKQLVKAANNGEAWAIKEIADRFDGKPAQAVSVTGKEGGAIDVALNVKFG